MKNLAVARRYAKALMLIGHGDGKAESYAEELDLVDKVFLSEKELTDIVLNPLFERTKRRDLLFSVIDKISISETMKTFIMLLFDKRRIAFVHEINGYYQKFVDDIKNIARATITSASPLSDEIVEQLKIALSRKTGKAVEVKLKTDPDIIGGIITTIGDLVYDGSIKRQLENMKESFKRGEVS